MQSWDDLRYFLALQRHGKLITAGRSLSVDYTTVGRRVRILESVLNTKLFEKKESGFEVTPAGHSLIPYAETVERTILGIEGGVSDKSKGISGKVRISAPEDIGSYFLAGYLSGFLQDHPGLEIDLSSSGKEIDLSRRNIDMMITTQRPSNENLFVKRLTDFSVGLFSSEKYVTENGKIENAENLCGRKLIFCEDDIFLKETVDNGMLSVCNKIALKSCSIVAQYKAIKSGYGLCLLPCFMQSEYKDLVRVLEKEIVINKTLWLVINEDMRNIDRVEAVSNFIADITYDARENFFKII